MSIRYMKWAWSTNLSPTSKLILIKLADHANELGACFPSIPQLAKQCSVSERTVQRSISEMAADGLIRIEKRFRKDGSQTSNLYHLLSCEARGANLSPMPVDGEETTLAALSTEGDSSDTQTISESLSIESPPQPKSGSWIYPECLTEGEQLSAASLIESLDKKDGQEVLDELAGRMRIATVRNPLRYLSVLVSKARNGAFKPELALEEQSRRANAMRLSKLNKARVDQSNRDANAPEVDMESLPDAIRSRLVSLKNQLQKNRDLAKKKGDSGDDH